MMTLFVVIAFAVAALALIWGARTEYQQSRMDGPIAIVPTLPFGIGSAILATMGTAILLRDTDTSFWFYISEFIVLGALFVLLINNLSANKK